MKDQFMTTNNLKIIIFIFILVHFFQKNLSSFENKIILKIDNEIITSIDLKNEMNYLTALNPGLKNLKTLEIEEISKKSLVREKIKKVEISKYFKDSKLPEKILERFLENIYSRIGIKNLEEFKKYLIKNNIEYVNVLDKIETEALWNELIISKFSKKVKINKDKLRREIISNNTSDKKSYLMSEIVFEVSTNEEIDNKYKKIINTISVDGFNNAALKYSISETAKIGGKLDWINENSLNKKIRDKLKSLEINEYTKPIQIPGGFIILKINDIKVSKSDENIENELKKLINQSNNRQLNQYSKIYFNKIKENVIINEI